MSEYPALLHKAGDIVTVRQDLSDHVYYNGIWLANPMLKYCGKTLTIRGKSVSVAGNVPYYYVKENGFIWCDAMFEDDIVEPVSLDLGDIL